MKLINTILIANRGEIASRIMRTCRKMGIKTIAVFSEADRNAPYVREADTAVFIGESSPSLSYLDQNKLIDVAKKMRADAIHPGYGFLAENIKFAERCQAEDIIFIGPNVKSIELMGSKSKAKNLMLELGVPVVPGYQGNDQSIERLRNEAGKIGFPVLLKATAGGGGKGMRIVEHEKDIDEAIAAAKRESMNAFGEDELIVEKYISSGRHIEIQIFGDQQDNAIHLLERECSIQRRYQKIIEESPSPIMDEDLRKKMGDTAVQIAKGLKYDNAGTVEFIYDDQTGDFYFLEVNTRLQVEHPVTEAITGLDLVQLQINIAQGLPLPIVQEEVKGNGYAIEVRLYAEDPNNGFMPVTGTIEQLIYPKVDGLRVESAIESGSAISVFYDPMIAKLIVWDQTRAEAHRKMQYVLQNLVCLGMTTNQDFLLQVLLHQDFLNGKYNTHFIQEKMELEQLPKQASSSIEMAAIAHCLHSWKKREDARSLLKSIPSGWRNNYYTDQVVSYLYKEETLNLAYRLHSDVFAFIINEKECSVQILSTNDNTIRLEIEGIQYSFIIVQKEQNCFIHTPSIGNIHIKELERFPTKVKEKVKGGFEAPMPSQVIKVLVETGQTVRSGDGLVVLSSMKMENTITADEDGVVEEVFVTEGANIEAGFLLLKLAEKN